MRLAALCDNDTAVGLRLASRKGKRNTFAPLAALRENLPRRTRRSRRQELGGLEIDVRTLIC